MSTLAGNGRSVARVQSRREYGRRTTQYADLVFITKYRGPWFRDGKPSGAITHEFRKSAGQAQSVPARSVVLHAAARFRRLPMRPATISPPRWIMGHADEVISDTYRERFPDERLRKVSDHVRAWLFGYGYKLTEGDST